MGGANHGYGIKQARIEQAACLDDEVEENKRIMDEAAKKVKQSIDWWMMLVLIAAIALVTTLVARNLTIREPTSEIVRSGNRVP